MQTALLLLISGLPPIKTAQDAQIQLATGRVEALENVAKACRGRLRHSLKDHPAVVKGLTQHSGSTRPDVAKAALDAHRCLSPAQYAAVLKLRLSGPPAIVAYAAEVSARVADPAVVPPLLDRLSEKAKDCLGGELSEAEADVCVWLTYAPGASLPGADKALRKRTAELAAKMTTAEHPKIREVAVETLAASKLAKYAPTIQDLIKKEKKGGFARKNDAALLSRFEKRRRALAKGER